MSTKKQGLALALATAVLATGVAAFGEPAAAAGPEPDPRQDAVADSGAALAGAPAAARRAAGDAFAVQAVQTDTDGGAHVRYRRTHRGLPVRGGDLIVHLGPEGSAEGITAAQTRPIAVDTTPTLDPAAATAAARAAFGREVGGPVQSVGVPRLLVDATGAAPALAYEVVVSGTRPHGVPSRLHVVLSARTGAVIGTSDEVHGAEGTGRSLYSGTVPLTTLANNGEFLMTDPTRGYFSVCGLRNTILETCSATELGHDADNAWGNGTNADPHSAMADAHYALAKNHDMLKNWVGRTGVRSDGKPLQAWVHFGDEVRGAFHYQGRIFLGDNTGNARPVGQLDVVAHEAAHSLTETTANLVYAGESGGLNEATSDIIGTMTEFYANNAVDRPDYTIAERINLNGTGAPLRYMYRPSLDGSSPDCWSGTVGGLDVHYSSGLGNKFFYMLAEGSNGAYGAAPTCGAPAVSGVGRLAATRIWYRALTTYFTSTTKYQVAGTNDARAGTLSAAADLYGVCSTQYKAVQAAWRATGVGGEDAACTGTFTSTTDVGIFDNATATSSLAVPIPGKVSAPLKVAVDIKHTRRGDLVIDLVAPSGTSYRLRSANPADTAGNLKATYTVSSATGQASTGTWRLRVSDVATGLNGYVDSWSLTFT